MWNLYIASVWAELLRQHALVTTGRAVEIGPGFGDKIGLALAELGFRGTLFVVEPNHEASSWVMQRYREILPRAQLVPVQDTVCGASRIILSQGVDAVLMNHAMDDLLLHAALPPARRHDVFASMRHSAASLPEVLSTWQRLLADRPRLLQLSRQVLDDLCTLLESIGARFFGASQYRSWFLTSHKLAGADLMGCCLLDKLAGRVGRTSAADQATLRRCGQDPRRWLLLAPPRTLRQVEETDASCVVMDGLTEGPRE